MSRLARVKGEFESYHIIQRGNERKPIFLSDEDRIRFLETLERMKQKYNFIVEAYCLMDNHIHLLINDNGNDISKIIKSINVSYVSYFNKTYKRVGHLFQDRFKSEIVSDNRYHLVVSAYIHNNPVQAGMVKLPEEYQWSSFNAIIGRKTNKPDLVDRKRILSLFSDDLQLAAREYYDYVNQYEAKKGILDIEEDQFTKSDPDYIISYEEAERMLYNELKKRGKAIIALKSDRELRQEIVKTMRQNSSLTLKEIGRLCGGLSQAMVWKILNQ